MFSWAIIRNRKDLRFFWHPAGHSPLRVPVDAAYVVSQTKVSLSPGAIIAVPQVGGLHRRYERRAA